jgi:acetyl-CoA acetyltransferase
MKSRDIAIIGYSETKIATKSGRSAYDLAGEAFASLLETSGIDKSEIDGLAVTAPLSEANPFYAAYMCGALGLSPTWLTLSGLGGASALSSVARAASAIRDGQCKMAVVLSADAPSTNWRTHYGAWRGEFMDPTGIQGPPGVFGLIMSRYTAQHELIPEALGKIAVTQREHALLNDNACDKFKKPLAMADYLRSRVIADPLRLLDSVMFCDGANAVLVTSSENARRIGAKRVVYPAAYAEISNHEAGEASPDIVETGLPAIAPKALANAGMSPGEIRMFHPYDDFTIAVIMQMEQIGFCERGQGSRFVLETDLSYRGKLPLNTGGGQLSAGQPGLASGGLNLVEAVRQMFGEAGARQVADPRNAVVTGIGCISFAQTWATSNLLILEQ